MSDQNKPKSLIDSAMKRVGEVIGGIIKDLSCDRENLIAALKEVDINCKFCKNHDNPVPCQKAPAEFVCDECSYDCPCRTCQDNSNYIWRGEVDLNG